MRKFSFLIIFVMLFTAILSSCAKDTSEDTESGFATAAERLEAVEKFYAENGLVNWQDIAAVYLMQNNIADFQYAEALEKNESYEDKCGMVIAISLLIKQKVDVSSYNIDGYVTMIKNNVESNYESMTIKQIALSVYALVASDTDYDFEAAAENILSRQNKDGGFPASKDIKISDTESSAYVLNVIMLNRELFPDECYNKVVTYLGTVISVDNTISDINGKKSARATALVLNALISARLPLDGQVSTSMSAAMDLFFRLPNGGYKKYLDDKNIDRETNGEVMLCLAATGYGNLWTKLQSENAKDVSDVSE